MASVVGVTELLNISVTPTPGAVQDTNTKQVNGNTVDTGTGAAGAGTQRVALATGSTVAATQSGTWDIGSISTLPSLPAGSNAIGSVSVSNFPATQPVSGSVAVSNFPATQPVSGTVGVSSLPSIPAGSNAIGSVSVSNFPATQPVSGSVSVSNFPATQPVSGTVAVSSLPSIPAGANAIGSVSVSNFPATQPVSGSVSVSNFPATQPVSGSVSVNDPSATTTYGPVTAANTVLFSAVDTANIQSIQLQIGGSISAGGIYLQASNDGTTYQPVQGTTFNDIQTQDTVFAPDLLNIPVTGKFFRAITTPDFVGSVSGRYALRFVESPMPFTQTTLVNLDPQVSVPVAGMTPAGMMRRITVADNGGVAPADGVVFQGSRQGASVGPIVQVDTTGYGTVLLQLQGTFTGTITFQVSNDGTSWVSAVAWPATGGAVPVSTATAVGQWVIPAAGRFFRAQITTAGTGVPVAIAVLKNWSAWMPLSSPSIAANSSVNVAQVGGGAVSNGIPLTGNGATNGASVSTLISAATNNLTQLKATLGRLYIIDIQNTVASIRYLKLFALPSASVTMGTTSATLNFSIPASGKLSIVTDLGINLGGTGISFALTGGSALTDNTAIGAGDLVCNFQFM